MLRALDISTSGLVAQRIRLDAISGNLANMSSVRNEKGELKPYQERFVVFQPDEDVQTQRRGGGRQGQRGPHRDGGTEVPLPARSSLAIKDGKWKGYVAYPNMDMMSPVRRFADRHACLRSQPGRHGSHEEPE